MTSECWGISTTVEERADYPADLAKYDGPDRTELLLLTVQHVALGEHVQVWKAEILRGNTGKPRLGEWRLQDKASRASGRLVDFQLTDTAPAEG